jgi:hypothetical protein
MKLLVKSVYIRDFSTWLANFVLCEVRVEAEGAAFLNVGTLWSQ